MTELQFDPSGFTIEGQCGCIRNLLVKMEDRKRMERSTQKFA